VLGQKVVFKGTVAQTLTSLLQTPVSAGGSQGTVGSGGGAVTVPAAVQSALAQAQTDYNNAVAALQAGDLGTYQTDINAMQVQITAAQSALAAAASTTTTTTTTTPTTTTTTVPPKNTKTNKLKTPTSTEPKATTTTSTLATAAPPS
jgi:hypothetical protein